MDTKTAVFQFEIRYNHILSFSQIARKVLSPYVRLAKSIRVENQNTVEERIILNFEEDDYLIIVCWDRILIKGQGDMNTYTTKNSSIETPFLNILDKIKELNEFGSIQNMLLAVNYIKKQNIEKEMLVEQFVSKTVNDGVSKLLENNTDVAITLENKKEGEETSISFGPYFGTNELKKRQIIPVNIDKLEGTDFLGTLLEYRHFKTTKEVVFNDFVEMVKISNEIKNKVWKTL